MENTLLSVKNLAIQFEDRKDSKKDGNTVVNHISFDVKAGEIVGLVGESGSGKSMTALAIMGLLKETAKITDGEIVFCNKDLQKMSEKEFIPYKGKEISMIFQEPMTSLNPLLKIGKQMDEMLLLHEKASKEECKNRSLEWLKEAGFEVPEKIYESYPHQLSGGMRQRVMIAMAMMNRPKLLIADEPTTALDVTIQAKILQLIKHLNEKYHMAVILVSHDLGVIKQVCDRAVVMYEGTIVEQGDVRELFYHPKQEYTKRLIDAIPRRKMLEDDWNQKQTKEVLTVQDLVVSYETSESLFHKVRKNGNRKEILHGVSFTLHKGEILGIVGESGCGKTTLVKSILGLTKIDSGHVDCHNCKLQMVFQDPYSSLNPCKKIGWLIEEPLRHQTTLSKEKRKHLVEEMIVSVGLSKEYLERKPGDLSGGQRQRIAIAMAVITKPEIIILDEPVSALDVTVQAQILELLEKLRDQYQLSYIFISHDLNVISQICDRTLVMYQGNIVEAGTIHEIFDEPKHQYTKKLLDHQIA